MSYGIPKRHEFFDGLSATSSTYTSGPILIADLWQMAVSWSSSGGASRMTIQMSNEDGFGTSLTTWSDVTGLTAQGIYAVESGGRWMRCVRASADSLGEVYLQGRT